MSSGDVHESDVDALTAAAATLRSRGDESGRASAEKLDRIIEDLKDAGRARSAERVRRSSEAAQEREG